MTNYSVSLETIHVIGHSFGSHVAGFTGKTVKTLTSSKVRQITALDPSRNPTFENSTASNRLHNEDAEIVVALHTDAGGHGFVEAIGLIDFYPNGGAAKQPACEESEEGETKKFLGEIRKIIYMLLFLNRGVQPWNGGRLLRRIRQQYKWICFDEVWII